MRDMHYAHLRSPKIHLKNHTWKTNVILPSPHELISFMNHHIHITTWLAISTNIQGSMQ